MDSKSHEPNGPQDQHHRHESAEPQADIERDASNPTDMTYEPPPPRRRPPGPFSTSPLDMPQLKLRWLVLLLVVVGYPLWLWFVVRTEVNANELLVIVNKTGRTIPQQYGDQVVLYPELVADLAAQTGWPEDKVSKSYKGIEYHVLREGRYFYSPIWYQRIKIQATLIPDSQFGVLVRKYGKPLPVGKTVATLPDERGPVAGTLPPGRHDINLLAYDVQLFPKVIVTEGWIGVQTRLSGDDPKIPNQYVVEKGARGVQPDTLGPGTYFDLNPYQIRVDLVDVRSQKYEMLKEEAIEFPSNDGFTVRMEANVEWAIYADRVPWVTVEVGDLEDVVTKVIRPYAMSLARIQGSKMTARDFIGARETFQRRLIADLRTRCRDQGVLIKAVNVRDLKPPEAVRSIIRERELADQTITRYENEISEAKAKAALVEQEQLANQQKEIGDANKQVVSKVVEAEQGMAVAVTEGNQRLGVAKLTLEAARKQAEAILSRGQADAKVVLFNYQAKAEPLRATVNAFGDGQTYARYMFLQKVAPAMHSILTNTDGPFSDIFYEFTSQGREPSSAQGVKIMSPTTGNAGAKGAPR